MFSIKRKFHRKVGQRRNFVRILAHDLIMHERMETTDARAREVRPVVEKLVTIAKRQQLASLRLLLRRLPVDAANKLYYDIAPKYKGRKGGYLRIVKMSGYRKRDAAQKAVVSFV
ncbi:MAG: 50S ribosomal protein L17 [Candidatus Harrisonbacteria bacterium]|nr:50S ribosomal protein L17 [Candidatus Harrisonbacteria bacterium]